jgi:LmbE family N-acetylglucosaminyl deacetylase
MRFVRFVRRPQVLAVAAVLCCIYIFLQSPPLWFVRLLPSEIPGRDAEGGRVLVIAPHPDDDILGVGSSIAAFREQGIPVVVVFLTSGDANVAGQRLVTMDPFLFAAEFRAIGTRRQKEAVVALGRLGVAPTNAIFLNYPDRGLSALLDSHWSALDPFRSPYTGRSAKYSSVALNPGGPYCGEALLGELESIISGFQPTIVYLPHPLDTHEDHRAGYKFVCRAIAELAETDPGLASPSLRSYLVHSYAGQWPTPSRLSDVLSMEPLDPFLELGTWHTTALSAQSIDAKYRALRAHTSQWWTCGTFMSWFVCSNELYMVEDS